MKKDWIVSSLLAMTALRRRPRLPGPAERLIAVGIGIGGVVRIGSRTPCDLRFLDLVPGFDLGLALERRSGERRRSDKLRARLQRRRLLRRRLEQHHTGWQGGGDDRLGGRIEIHPGRAQPVGGDTNDRPGRILVSNGLSFGKEIRANAQERQERAADVCKVTKQGHFDARKYLSPQFARLSGNRRLVRCVWPHPLSVQML